jgi:hypothetical protein
MTRIRLRHWLVPLLLLSSLSTLAADAPTGTTAARVDVLLARLAEGAAEHLRFREERSSALLSEVLVLEGQLSRPEPGTLVREVEQPYRERTTLQAEQVLLEREGERPRRFSLRRAPELGGLLASFQALIEADRSLLEHHYTLSLDGDASGFSLELTPHERRLAKRVDGLRLIGADAALRCMHLRQADGAESWLWLGEAAAAAAALPTAAERIALCGGPVAESTHVD